MEERYTIKTNVKNTDLQFHTSEQLFSPTGIDKGTLSMLSVMDFKETDKVLDLGCGYGVVGILAAKFTDPSQVVMSDKESLAVEFAKKNAVLNGVDGIKIIQSDGFKNIDDKEFTLILSNPPYHTDFSVAKEFIEKGFNRLCIGGHMYIVTKRKDWYKNKLTAIFGGVKIWEVENYFVFMSMKKDHKYANA